MSLRSEEISLVKSACGCGWALGRIKVIEMVEAYGLVGELFFIFYSLVERESKSYFFFLFLIFFFFLIFLLSIFLIPFFLISAHISLYNFFWIMTKKYWYRKKIKGPFSHVKWGGVSCWISRVQFKIRGLCCLDAGMIKTFSVIMLQFYADYDQVERRIMWFIRFSTFC